MRIHENALDLLDRSSPDGVALAMHRVSTNLNGESWLSRSHRYRDRGRGRGNNRFKDDLSNGTVHTADMADYVGVSAPLHTLDGWALLGRAIHCLLRGDAYAAVHLAYYAELRAGLAILASQGVGVFDRTHCVVDETGGCLLVDALDESEGKIGNHQWTWLVFQWWAEQGQAIDLLRTVIRPGGHALETWIGAMNKAKFALQYIGTDWLHMWGLDIGRFFADREARNAASYWPNTVNAWDTRGAVEDYGTIVDLWITLEPASETRFPELDRHLLRILLRDGHSSASGGVTTSQAGVVGFDREVEAIIHNMALGGLSRDSWREFLIDGNSQAPALIRLASGRTKLGRAGHVLEVMARGTMLLRLATGASAMLLSEAGIARQDVCCWVDSIGEGRGIWIPSSGPIDLVDLWADIEAVLERQDEVAGTGMLGRQTMWSREARELNLLAECERVALWGLGL